MSSGGQIIGGIAGAALGFFVPGLGPILGAQLGLMVGGMIDPPKGPSITGPRLEDLSVQTSTYGAPLPRGYGTVCVTGNIFWLENDQLKEWTTTEESGGKGGGGQEVTSYHYSATFAVGLLHVPDGATVALRRLWIDTDLIYEAGSTDADSIIASNAANGFVFYDGADDQLPNPRMQADKGAANVSAYPGLCYIVFEDLSLEKYSNTLLRAQVKAELVIGSPTTAIAQIDTLPDAPEGSPVRIETSACAVSRSGMDYMIIFQDVADLRVRRWENRRIIFGENDALLSARDEIIYGAGTSISIQKTQQCAPDGLASYLVVSNYITSKTSFIRLAGSGDPVGSSTTYDTSQIAYGRVWAFADENGAAWVVCRDQIQPIHYLNAASLQQSSTENIKASGIGYGENYLLVVDATASSISSATVKRFDKITLGLIDTLTQPVSGDQGYLYVISDNEFYLRSKTHISYWIDGVATDLGEISILNSAARAGGWFMTDPNPLYSVQVCEPGTGQPTEIYLAHALVDATPGKLRDIVTDECALAGIVSGDLDLTGLTNSDVRGFRVAQRGAVRNSLEPLQAAYPFDVAQSGYKIKFMSRGGASVASIPEEDLAATDGTPGVLLPVAREMDSQLPFRVSIRYADPDREYDIGEQAVERYEKDSLNERVIELPMSLTSGEAIQMADVLLAKDWTERVDFGPFSLPPTWRHLEPSDVVTVTHRGQDYTLRLTRVEYLPDGRLVCNAKMTSAASYTSSATAQSPLVVGQSLVPLKGRTSAYLLDIPRVRSEQDVPGLCYGLSGLSSGWPGATLLRSDDSGNSYQAVGAVNARVHVFVAGAAIGAHNGFSIDHASILTVTPSYAAHTLASVNEDQFYAYSNLAAYGTDGRWEIVAFKTVTDNSGTYTIKDFLRGLYGSEWATGLHASGDYFIPLDVGTVSFLGLPSDAIGSPRLYRAVTQGNALDSTSDITDTYDAYNLKPLSPVDCNGNRDPATLNWTITAERRTRHPVELFSGATVPLGETSEAYELELWNSSFTTLYRTFTGLTTPSATWTAAMQTSDTATTSNATIYFRWYQLSAAVGRGLVYQGSLTRSIKVDGSGYSSAVLALSPIGYYKMDGNTTTITDASTSANNGTASASNVTYQQPSLFTGAAPGYAIKFTAGYVSVPHIAAMNGAFSMAFLMKIDALPAAESSFMHKGDTTVGGSQGFYLTMLTDGKIKLNWFNGSWRSVQTTSAYFSAGAKTFVGLKYNGTNALTIYKNGSLVETLSMSAAIVNNSLAFLINAGKSGTISGFTANNTIDEFAWFNTQLTDAQFAALYEET